MQSSQPEATRWEVVPSDGEVRVLLLQYTGILLKYLHTQGYYSYCMYYRDFSSITAEIPANTRLLQLLHVMQVFQ